MSLFQTFLVTGSPWIVCVPSFSFPGTVGFVSVPFRSLGLTERKYKCLFPQSTACAVLAKKRDMLNSSSLDPSLTLDQ